MLSSIGKFQNRLKGMVKPDSLFWIWSFVGWGSCLVHRIYCYQRLGQCYLLLRVFTNLVSYITVFSGLIFYVRPTLSGRGEALKSAAEAFGKLSVGSKNQAQCEIPVCSCLSGLRKTWMLEEWGRIFDLAQISQITWMHCCCNTTGPSANQLKEWQQLRLSLVDYFIYYSWRVSDPYSTTGWMVYYLKIQRSCALQLLWRVFIIIF